MPADVRDATKNNPDMAGCNSHVWEKHLIQEEKSTLKDLQAQLLKLQLSEARATATEKKKQKPEPKKAMVASTDSDFPDSHPVPEGNVMYQGYNGQRGRGGRGGYGGRGSFRGQPRNMGGGTCFLCGKTGHWVREYPGNPNNQQQDTCQSYGPPKEEEAVHHRQEARHEGDTSRKCRFHNNRQGWEWPGPQ